MAASWNEQEGWGETEERLFEEMAHDTGALYDPYLQAAFDVAYYDDTVDHFIRVETREWIHDYIEETYGFDFDDYFDWQAWREEHGYE